MPLKQCEKIGHFYDSAIHSQCPYCNELNNVTRLPDAGVIMPPFDQTPPIGPDEDDMYGDCFDRVDPVVGWLVVINGHERGRDYHIHSDNNFIGRHEKSDICLRGYEEIYREKHANISYDTHENKYYLSPGEGPRLIRHNSEAIFKTVELQAYDIIEMGRTQFLFLPLCSERFTWTK